MEYDILFSKLDTKVGVLLEVGCGMLPFLEEESKKSAHIIGVDIDAGSLTRAKRKALTLGVLKKVSLLRCDACRMPLVSSSVDIVICNSAIEHIQYYDLAISEMSRALRSEGLLLLTTDSRGRPVLAHLLDKLPFAVKQELVKKEVLAERSFSNGMFRIHSSSYSVKTYFEREQLSKLLAANEFVIQWSLFYHTVLGALIFELVVLLRGIGFGSVLYRRLSPLFYALSLIDSILPKTRGWGLALGAKKR